MTVAGVEWHQLKEQETEITRQQKYSIEMAQINAKYWIKTTATVNWNPSSKLASQLDYCVTSKPNQQDAVF